MNEMDAKVCGIVMVTGASVCPPDSLVPLSRKRSSSRSAGNALRLAVRLAGSQVH
jgi:hypothetical protein